MKTPSLIFQARSLRNPPAWPPCTGQPLPQPPLPPPPLPRASPAHPSRQPQPLRHHASIIIKATIITAVRCHEHRIKGTGAEEMRWNSDQSNVRATVVEITGVVVFFESNLLITGLLNGAAVFIIHYISKTRLAIGILRACYLTLKFSFESEDCLSNFTKCK